MSGIKENYTYYIECVHFDSELPKRAATVSGPEPGSPVLCDVNYHNKNQQFYVTPAIEGQGGYNFTPVDPQSNIFVGLLVLGARVVATPYQKRAFQLRQTDPTHLNVYQIFVESGDKEYAFQVGEATRPGYPREITLQLSDPTNTYQIWRFVPVPASETA